MSALGKWWRGLGPITQKIVIGAGVGTVLIGTVAIAAREPSKPGRNPWITLSQDDEIRIVAAYALKHETDCATLQTFGDKLKAAGYDDLGQKFVERARAIVCAPQPPGARHGARSIT